MKKIAVLSFILILISAAAPAQRITGVFGRPQGTHHQDITKHERKQLRKDMIRLKITQRNARRDGIVTPFEKRRITKAKRDARRDAFRYKHNGRLI